MCRSHIVRVMGENNMFSYYIRTCYCNKNDCMDKDS